MIIQFSLKNYKVFKEQATLSFVASNYDKDVREDENVIPISDFKLRLLKSAVVYGANASGKSKLIEGLNFMRNFVIHSAKESQTGEAIDVAPFRLSTESEESSSEFETVFIKNNELFRYGFEVNNKIIVSEWLYHRPHTKEVEIFYREKQNFEIHQRLFKSARMIVKEELVRDNSLLLSVAAQFNIELAKTVLEWFKGVRTISGLSEEGYHGFTMRKTTDTDSKKKILKLIKAADLGIIDISAQKLDLENLPKDMPNQVKEIIRKKISEENAEFLSDIQTTHKKFDENKKSVGIEEFSLENDESSGTKKFFALTGPVLDALEKGYILAIDEMDSKLHPNLTCKLISMFNSSKSNPRNAQLVFNTHNTNLLDSGLFRRDQIWFTQKDKYGVAKLFSLSDFKSTEVRKDERFEDNYIRGKYGAIPYLDYFNDIINQEKLLANDEG